MLEVLDPTGLPQPEQADRYTQLADRFPDLASTRIGFLDSLKAGARHLLNGLAGKMASDLGIKPAFWQKSGELGSNGPLEFAEEIAENADAVINAVGDCGSCTSWTVTDSVLLERLGVPTVTLVTEPFVSLAHVRAASLGIPNLRIVSVPHPVYTRSPEELEALAVERFDEVCKALAAASERSRVGAA